MAQKVFEGDVVFSILTDREKSTNKNRESNISFENFLGHLRDPRVFYDPYDMVKSRQFLFEMNFQGHKLYKKQ